MPDVLDIYWFSGTGNTLIVARAMAQEFRAHDWDVRLLPMSDVDPSAIRPSGWVGLAFPVAVQTTYPLVWAFCERLTPGQDAPIFMVDTLAGFGSRRGSYMATVSWSTPVSHWILR